MISEPPALAIDADVSVDEEVVVYKSLKSPKMKLISHHSDEDDEYDIFEELARRRMAALKTLNPVLEDAKKLLEKKEEIAVKDDAPLRAFQPIQKPKWKDHRDLIDYKNIGYESSGQDDVNLK